MPDPDQPPEPNRVARRALKTRQRLLESALSVFTQHGIDACSIEDITEKADVGKGTFYRHFDDKRDVLLSLAEAAAKDLVTALRETSLESAALPEALNRLMAAEAAWYHRRSDGFRLLLQVNAMLTVQPPNAAELRGPFITVIAAIEDLVRPLATAPADAAGLRRLAMAVLSVPFGALAFQQALFPGETSDTTAAMRSSVSAVLPQLLRCAV